MAESNRNETEFRTGERDTPQYAGAPGSLERERQWREGYDETARWGPPLESDVARGEYRPHRYWLAGAGVRGYGDPEAHDHWGKGAYDDEGGGYGRGPGGLQESPGADLGRVYGSDEVAGPPPDFGSPNAWGRLGGWHHSGTGAQRRRGPKGYQRSDERIREDLCEHLMNIGDIDSSDVEIRVEKGVVVLEGTVPERSMKYEIEDIAATTLGVKDVENTLRVPRRDSPLAT